MIFWEFVGHFFFYPLTHLCKLNNNKGLAQVFCQELCNVGLIAPYRIDRSLKTTHNSLHFLCKNNNIEDITMHDSYVIDVPKARLIRINPECSSYTELPLKRHLRWQLLGLSWVVIEFSALSRREDNL